MQPSVFTARGSEKIDMSKKAMRCRKNEIFLELLLSKLSEAIKFSLSVSNLSFLN